MARVLDSFPDRTEPRGLYPWDEWLDGKPWHLHRGEGRDYLKPTQSFRSAAQQAARVRKGKVKTRVTDAGEGIVIQFYKPEKATPEQ